MLLFLFTRRLSIGTSFSLSPPSALYSRLRRMGAGREPGQQRATDIDYLYIDLKARVNQPVG